MKNTAYQLLILIFTLNFQGFGQEKITLSQAIQSALSNKKAIQASKIDIELQRLQTEALYKKYYPQISLDYTYQYNPILQSSILPIGKFNPSLPSDATERVQFGTTWSQAAGLTITQPLIDFSLKKRIAENRLQEKIAGATQAQNEYELAYDVAKSYINIGLQQEQIRSTVLDSVRTWVSFKLQKDKFDAGKLLKSDLNKALINHNNTKQKITDAISQVIENKVYLLFLTGNDNTDIEIDTTFFKQDLSLQNQSKSNLDAIPILQQLIIQQQLTVLKIQTEKTKYLPTIGLKGFLGANQFTNNFNPVEANSWFGYANIGLVVKLPILIGEDKNSIRQQLKLQENQLSMQANDKQEQFTQETTIANLKISNLQTQIKTLKENLLFSQESLRIIQKRVEAGQQTASYLNTEELELQRIAFDYNNIQKQTWIYWLDYLKASGKLNQLWKKD
jgi:outer membrane protein TolC